MPFPFLSALHFLCGRGTSINEPTVTSRQRLRWMEQREQGVFQRWIAALRSNLPLLKARAEMDTSNSLGTPSVESNTQLGGRKSSLKTGFREILASKLVYIFGRY